MKYVYYSDIERLLWCITSKLTWLVHMISGSWLLSFGRFLSCMLCKRYLVHWRWCCVVNFACVSLLLNAYLLFINYVLDLLVLLSGKYSFLFWSCGQWQRSNGKEINYNDEDVYIYFYICTYSATNTFVKWTSYLPVLVWETYSPDIELWSCWTVIVRLQHEQKV